MPGSIQIGHRWYARIVLAVVILLAVGAAVLAAALWREMRHRRSAAAALQRMRRDSVARAELSEALASRDALLAAPAGPVLVDGPDGSVRRANPVARALAPELIDEPAPRELADALAACRMTGKPQQAEVTVYQPERCRYRASVRPYSTPDGQACVAVLVDTSESDDFRDARRLFSAGVSHELRTPLARILALVDTLALPLDEPSRMEIIGQARAEVDAMRELIEDMILLVRLESHELTVSAERTDLTAAVDSCVTRHADAAEEHGMRLNGDATGGLVVAVASRLVDVVLDNLVANAIRHAGEGARITIRARGLAGAVELTVHDTGVGIPPEHVDRVFERFYRVEDARSGPGTGLGLAIVKHIAEEHGGRATVESARGRGTTFRIVLPAPAVMEERVAEVL